MKLFSAFGVLGLLASAMVACSAPTTSQTPANGSLASAAPAVLAEPNDVELKTLSQSYTGFASLNAQLRLSPQHGGIYVRTHLDPVALKAFNAKSYPFPEGALAFKEGHVGTEGPIDRIYVMKKIPGYDPANGDWFYAMLAPDGAPRLKGKVPLCINCHAGAKNKDYIFGFE